MGNMKANRRFVEGEEAVSAVIGVILMVAITVAIAATVYVYVSGMITPEETGKLISATLEGTDSANKAARFKVANADAGIAWSKCTVKWHNHTCTEGQNITDTATGGSPMTGNIATADWFWIIIGDTGTYQIDLLFEGNIIWTSATFDL